MNIGYLYIFFYILLVGVGTFLQKFSLKEMTAFQLEFLIAISMIVIAPIALFLAQKNMSIPFADIPVGVLVGLLFVIGSFAFTLSLTKLPAGTVTSVSFLYLIVVFLLSVFFHLENITVGRIIGIVLMLVGTIFLVK